MEIPPNRITGGARHEHRQRNMEEKLRTETRIAFVIIFLLSGAFVAFAMALSL